MGFLSVLLLVVFVIVTVLLVLMVLIQSEDGDSLGGLFGGGSNSAFGSRSGNVLTKTTSILGALFLIGSLSLALVNRTPRSVINEVRAIEMQAEEDSGWLQSRLEGKEDLSGDSQADTNSLQDN